ncbi:hypothetical protein DERP_012793 [Dermatophagoides pteronyssinus]|uniref:Uncharacterized protein n=1 Tax=Dermatophagoides pteronyssinus TaxID=6956 RepID=A0ABQ8JF30_DERPT|nr:hypothetical protein DERP_012793 [Dermatophagoides pteronyssinus]
MGRVSVDVEDAEAANVASVEADSAVVVVVGAGSLDNDEPNNYFDDDVDGGGGGGSEVSSYIANRTKPSEGCPYLGDMIIIVINSKKTWNKIVL